MKAEVTELWNAADSARAFAAALEERGYVLCKGDRRDFCIIDPAGNEHSLARRIAGAKASDIRSRMAAIGRDALPSVAQGRAQAQQRRATWEAEQQHRGEGRGSDDAETGARWQERKREARDAIAAAEPFARQIREEGEVRHQGMGGLSWWQRVVEFGRGLYQDAREEVSNS